MADWFIDDDVDLRARGTVDQATTTALLAGHKLSKVGTRTDRSLWSDRARRWATAMGKTFRSYSPRNGDKTTIWLEL